MKTPKWTEEALTADAAHYLSRGEWRKRSPSAYTTAAASGLLEKIKPKPADRPNFEFAEWRSVKCQGIEQHAYEVSSMGEVRSKIETSTKAAGHVFKQSLDTNGYPILRLRKSDGGSVTTKVHRMVAAAFLGEADGLQVNHKDGIKTNNAVANLEYVDGAENIRHAIRSGLMAGAIVVFGQTMSIQEAADRYAPKGLSADRIGIRIRRNKWAAEEAVTTPVLPTGIARGQKGKHAGR
jgi:hypothetical protein